MTERRGPLESAPWPNAIEALAIDDAEPSPRVHGYAVDDDLAVHHRFSDVLFLALTGELPEDGVGRAFEIALTFAVPASVREAPVHAGVLAALCGASTGGLLATGAVAVADAVGRAVDAVLARNEDDGEAAESSHASVTSLTKSLDGLVRAPLLPRAQSRDEAIVSVLHACGLTARAQLVTAMSLARLAAVAAESLPRRAGDFGRYPTTTPRFENDG